MILFPLICYAINRKKIKRLERELAKANSGKFDKRQCQSFHEQQLFIKGEQMRTCKITLTSKSSFAKLDQYHIFCKS